jgi:nicotinamide riboside kinase
MSVRRIAIVGAESTGKSWLAQTLTEVLRERGQTAHWVQEHLRLWCEREGRTPRPHEQAGIAQAQAEAVLAIDSGTVFADTTPLMTAIYSHHLFGDDSLYPQALAHQRLFDMTLVTGLDLPWVPDGLQRDGPQVREPIDALVRQTLVQAHLDFRVVYGKGLARLNHALLALGWPAEDEATWQNRESAQFALNAGRTPWLCDKCSDPACEHRLFTGLLR